MSSEMTMKHVGEFCFSLLDVIGTGYSSTVYKGKHSSSADVVAIKVIPKIPNPSRIAQTLLKNELTVLQRINHPNLLRVHEIYESKNNTYIISEYCEQGDLSSYVEQRRLEEPEILRILCQLVQGLKALVEKKVVHRDLKPANILQSHGVFKIADFGFALIFDEQQSILKQFHAGTKSYMAPEILEDNACSTKSDIWSLGVILYQMVYQLLPFKAKSDIELIRMQRRGLPALERDNKLSPRLKTLIMGMLQTDPFLRFGLQKIEMLLEGPKLVRQASLNFDSLVESDKGSVKERMIGCVTHTSEKDVLNRIAEIQQTQGAKLHQSRKSILVPPVSNQLKFMLHSRESFQTPTTKKFHTSSESTDTKTPNLTSASNNEANLTFSTENSSGTNKNASSPALPAMWRPTLRFCQFLDRLVQDVLSTDQLRGDHLKAAVVLRRVQIQKAGEIMDEVDEQNQAALRAMMKQFDHMISNPTFFILRSDSEVGMYLNKSTQVSVQEMMETAIKLCNRLAQTEQLQQAVEVLSDSLKHKNSHLLFARRWMNQQA